MDNGPESSRRIADFRRAHGFAQDEEHCSIWMAKLGAFEMPLPNFRWRRSVLAQHDNHHLLTGFDTSAKGELQVASWELGARVYDDWRQRGLCRFLMALGLLACPRCVWRAYQQGKECTAGCRRQNR